MKEPQFKTGNVGVEFVDESQVANKDDEVLTSMVNANVGKETNAGQKG